jgi:hypothetical protein
MRGWSRYGGWRRHAYQFGLEWVICPAELSDRNCEVAYPDPELKGVWVPWKTLERVRLTLRRTYAGQPSPNP